MSNSLWPHGLHARLSCPSTTPGPCSNSCPLSQWCHWITSSSVIPFFFLLSIFPSIRVFSKESIPFHQLTKVLELQLQHQSFQWIFRTDLFYNWLVWSPCCPRDSQGSSPTPQFKGINSLVLIFLSSPLSHLYLTTGKTAWLLDRPLLAKQCLCFLICYLGLS